MSMHSPDRVNAQWRADTGPAPVRLLLAGVEGEAGALAGAKAAGFPLELVIADPGQPVDPSVLSGAAAAVVQVNSDDPASIARFEELAKGPVPLIAAAYEPPLAFVRKLVRAGAHDVVPLPLDPEELETALDPIRRMASAQGKRARAGRQKIVTMIKSEGGVGATALLGQLATRFAAGEAAAGRECCLIDLDVQFGDAAFQLGLQPRLSLADLLEAGNRLDSALLRSTTTEHRSGLKVIAAPPEMMPLEGLSNEHLMEIVELATREFGTVFLDFPTNWTNWSLSLVARSDLVLLVTELSVAGLNRAKRQLQLLDSQELGTLDVRVVANRFEKTMLRTIRPADVRQALGQDIAYTVSNDFAVMRAAIDRGVPITEIKRKSALSSDVDLLEGGVAAALGLER